MNRTTWIRTILRQCNICRAAPRTVSRAQRVNDMSSLGSFIVHIAQTPQVLCDWEGEICLTDPPLQLKEGDGALVCGRLSGSSQASTLSLQRASEFLLKPSINIE